MQQDNEIKVKIIELFDTVIEAGYFVKNRGLTDQEEMFLDIITAITQLEDQIEGLTKDIQINNKLVEIYKNIEWCTNNIQECIRKQELEYAQICFEREFLPLLKYWKDYAQFYIFYLDDQVALNDRFKEEKEYISSLSKAKKVDKIKQYKYAASIIVLLYNNKEMTAECLESIEKYTKNISYELITINNGSDEETTKWHDQLAHKKKIYFKYNLGASIAASVVLNNIDDIAEGKYVFFVSNDVIVTESWAQNLIACMESDESIGLAVPVCNSLSNVQTIPVSYKNMDEMQMFAKEYNRLDPKKWKQRSRLLPFLGSFRREALEDLKYFLDIYFCYDMFADDDFSVRLRRLGYKQILCFDTFVHHYGSATIKESQHEVMDKGRQQFLYKYGIDSWESLANEGFDALCYLKNTDHVNILAVNPKWAEGVFSVIYQLQLNGCTNIKVDALTEQEEYLDDLKVMFENTGMLNEENEWLTDKKYDYILVSGNIEESSNIRILLDLTAKHLANSGSMLTNTKNLYQYGNLARMLYLKSVDVKDKVEHFITPENFIDLLKKYGLHISEMKRVLDSSSARYKTTLESLTDIFGIEDAEEFVATMSTLWNIYRIQLEVSRTNGK